MRRPPRNSPARVRVSEWAERRIHVIRGQKVMLDADLALLYGVPTKALAQGVRRNASRFPADFMFQLTAEEFSALRSQSVTSKTRGGRRYAPLAFTEQGVAMLSSVLRSPRSIQANIQIMRAFVRLRVMLAARRDLTRRLDALERRYDGQFSTVFEVLRELTAPSRPMVRRRIGFHPRVQSG